MTVQIFGDVSRDSSNDPIGSVYTPGTANSDLTPMQGGPRTTDSNGKTSAPAAISGSVTELAGLTAGALNADLLAATDVSAYKAVTIQVGGTWTGTLIVHGSNDNFTNFNQVQFIAANGSAGFGSPVSNIQTNNIYIIPVSFRYIRIRMTSYTSGTATGVVELPTIPPMLIQMAVAGTVQPGNTPNTTPWLTSDQPATSGGDTTYHAIAAATNNAAAIKGSAGQVYGWEIYNNAAAARFVKLYNKATAPAPATDNALLKEVIGLAANSRASYFTNKGIAFPAGIGIAAVTGIADTDNTSTVANDLSITIEFT